MIKRIITAIIALLIFVPVVFYGSFPFILLVYLMATIGLYELIRMKQTLKIVPVIFSFIFLWFILWPTTELNISHFQFTKIDLIILYIILLLIYTVASKNKFTFDDASFLLLASIYIGFGFCLLIETRSLGLNYILFVLFLIWGTDTGAYFTGMAIGKHKLWPEISPKKTIEGALGGIILAIIIGIAFHLIHPFDHPLYIMIFIVISISVMGQIGDLVASAFKRHFNVKDSGKLFPGHGGILDRMDSLLFVLLFIYIIQFI